MLSNDRLFEILSADSASDFELCAYSKGLEKKQELISTLEIQSKQYLHSR